MVHLNILLAIALPAISVSALPQPSSCDETLCIRGVDHLHSHGVYVARRSLFQNGKQFPPQPTLVKRTKESAKKPAEKKQTGESSKRAEAAPKKQGGEASAAKKPTAAEKRRDNTSDKAVAKKQTKITQTFKPTNPKPATKQAKLDKYGFTKETVKKAAPKKNEFVPAKPKSVMGKITDTFKEKDRKTYEHQLKNVYRVPENKHPNIVKGIDKEAEYMTGTKASDKNFENWRKQRAEPKANRNEAQGKVDTQEKAGFDNKHKKQVLTAQLGSAGVAGGVGSLTAAHTGAILRRRDVSVNEDLWMLMVLGEL